MSAVRVQVSRPATLTKAFELAICVEESNWLMQEYLLCNVEHWIHRYYGEAANSLGQYFLFTS